MANDRAKIGYDLIRLGSLIISNQDIERSLNLMGWEDEARRFAQSKRLGPILSEKVPEDLQELASIFDIVDRIALPSIIGEVLMTTGEYMADLSLMMATLRSALKMPLTILTIFIVIVIAIIFLVMPMFGKLFVALNVSVSYLDALMRMPLITRITITLVGSAITVFILKLSPIGVNTLMKLVYRNKHYREGMKQFKSAILMIVIKIVARTGGAVQINDIIEQMGFDVNDLHNEVSLEAYQLYKEALINPTTASQAIDRMLPYVFKLAQVEIQEAGDAVSNLVKIVSMVFIGTGIVGLYYFMYSTIMQLQQIG